MGMIPTGASAVCVLVDGRKTPPIHIATSYIVCGGGGGGSGGGCICVVVIILNRH